MGIKVKRIIFFSILKKKTYYIVRHLIYQLCYLYRFVFIFRYQVYSSSVHPKAVISNGVIIRKKTSVARGVKIGGHTFINANTMIDSSVNSIGRYCSISHNVKIGLIPHPTDTPSTSPVFYSINRGFVSEELVVYNQKSSIGNDVFIAANAIILHGVSIGNGAVVAAGSVVTKNVPDFAVVAGIPAKIIKYREPVMDKVNPELTWDWWEMEPLSLLEEDDRFRYKRTIK